MTDLKYIISKYDTEISHAECVQQPEFDTFLVECYPLSRRSGILKINEHIERSYHIITEQKKMMDQKESEEYTVRTEIARIRVLYKHDQTEVMIEGRKSEEVLESLRKKNGFSWEEKKDNYLGRNHVRTYNSRNHSI